MGFGVLSFGLGGSLSSFKCGLEGWGFKGLGMRGWRLGADVRMSGWGSVDLGLGASESSVPRDFRATGRGLSYSVHKT